MNFERKAESIAYQIRTSQAELKSLASKLTRAAAKTEALLAIASDVGVTALSIGKKHPLVGNEGWPFGYAGSVFTSKTDEVNGWPAAWHITQKAGIGGGSGNSGQHQADTSELIDGVYECRDGVWARIDLATND